MVILDVEVGGIKKPLYMDGTLHNQLTTVVKPAVQKKDFDYVIVIDGEEGTGKSVFGFQLAKVLDPSFNLSRVCFTPNEFLNAIVNAKPHQCICFDEGFTGLSSRSSLSEVNQLLVSLMMEMRAKNLFVIIIMPTFFMLDKYAALHRAKGLFHIYLREGKRGYWVFYNKERMKLLYFKGRKTYDYQNTKYIIFGRFRDQYTIDEKEYRKRKRNALMKKKRITKADSYKLQRDTLIFILNQDLKKNQSQIVRLCKKRDFSIDQSTISDIIVTRTKLIMNATQK